MTTRSLLLLAGLSLAMPRSRAEDSIAYKYQDYRESAGRIAVQTQGASLSKDLGPDTVLKVDGTIDAIAGATPTGQLPAAGSDQVPVSHLVERRKAWDGELARQIKRVNIAVGAANSRESDYVSTGWSLNTRTDFNQKNTTLLAGIAGTTDRIKVIYQKPNERKRTADIILGVSQLVDPNTTIQLNLSWGHAAGFLNDQYKLVEKQREVLPGVFLPTTYFESRPHERNKTIEMLSINHAIPGTRSAVEMSYRHYSDTFAVASDTVAFTFFQHLLGDSLVLQPEARWFRQSAADFYYFNLNNTAIVPTLNRPPVNGPSFSSDYRLSALSTDTVGLKLVWNAMSWLRLDAALERYRMTGRDHVTPASAYPRATIATFGGRATW